jgi:hypothetical protein
MTDWKSRLRESDPARDADMSLADVRRIRSVVLAAASEQDRSRGFVWPRSFVVTTAALTLTCAVALVALQQSIIESRRIGGSGADGSVTTETTDPSPVVQKQQLQFATPGGTRIIWVFDSEFDTKGTLP